MKLNFDKLFDRIKAEGFSQKEFMNMAGVASATLTRMRNNQNVNTESICKACDFFGCMPEDIVTWIPEENLLAKRKEAERRKIEQEIAELQAKLAQM